MHVLIKELKKLKPADEIFEAKFKVLGELVKHHIEEEEGEMLPKAEKSDIDWEKLETTVIGTQRSPPNQRNNGAGRKQKASKGRR